MPASIGVNLRVTGHCRQGGRKYMEDFFSVAYQQTEDERDLEYAFFGIYDGHGGAEAAAFAKEHLMETIVRHRHFWSDDDEEVLRSIKMGYIATHYAMWRAQEHWPKTASGLPSTAGTTASIAFIRRGKIYIGHVGDSAVVLGYQEPGSTDWKARALTKDHKPECAMEMTRIQKCGGKVVSKSGVPRVVWNRPRIGHKGPVRRSTPIDEIPFLAVARSLGDLWSYNSELDAFVVSPDPDCSVIPIDASQFRCLIFGTDGLFNMLSPQMAVSMVQHAEKHNEEAALSDIPKRMWLNPSKCLVEKALELWSNTKMRADNTSVVTLMLDPPGPPRAEVLRNRKKNLPDNGLRIVTRYANDDSENSAGKEKSTSNVSVSSSETEPLAPLRSSSDEEISKVDDNATSEKVNFSPKPRESLGFDPRSSSPKNLGEVKSNEFKNNCTSKMEALKIGTTSPDRCANCQKSDNYPETISTSSSSEVLPSESDASGVSEESIQINEVSSSSSEFFDSEDSENHVSNRKSKFRKQPFRTPEVFLGKRRRLEDSKTVNVKRQKTSFPMEPEPKHYLRVRKTVVETSKQKSFSKKDEKKQESVNKRQEMVNALDSTYKYSKRLSNNKKQTKEETALRSMRSTKLVLVDKNILADNKNNLKEELKSDIRGMLRVTCSTSGAVKSTTNVKAPKIKLRLREKIANKLADKKILAKVKKVAKLKKSVNKIKKEEIIVGTKVNRRIESIERSKVEKGKINDRNKINEKNKINLGLKINKAIKGKERVKVGERAENNVKDKMNKENQKSPVTRVPSSRKSPMSKDKKLRRTKSESSAKSRTLQINYIKKLRNHVVSRNQRK